MTFKVCNLGSKYAYFNSVYVVRVPIFSFRAVLPSGWLLSGNLINIALCKGPLSNKTSVKKKMGENRHLMLMEFCLSSSMVVWSSYV